MYGTPTSTGIDRSAQTCDPNSVPRGKMLHHVSIGVRDIKVTKAFYDATLAPLGYTCLRSRDTWLGYGKDRVVFSVRLSASPVPSDPASGLHYCFIAPTRKSVVEFHDAALLTGGRDNGKPGIRAD